MNKNTKKLQIYKLFQNSKKYSVNDAFRDIIRLTDNSSIDGVYVERDSIKIPLLGKRLNDQIFEPKSDIKLISFIRPLLG